MAGVDNFSRQPSMTLLDEAKFLSVKENKMVISSILKLGDQSLNAFESASFLFTEKLVGIKNIVVAGMGGSALGAHIARSLLSDRIKVPVFIINNYGLPEFVNEESLVILSSYSGGTEEVLSCFKEAKVKKAKMAVLTLGGELLELAKRNNIPSCVFSAEFNPSGAPRMGLGFAVFGIIGILSKLGLADFGKAETKKAISTLQKFAKAFGANVPASKNAAKKIALKLYEKFPVLVGSEFLTGNLHALQNQIHETAKTFASYFELPELNHHLLEGLENPKGLKKNMFFLFFESNLYNKRTVKRYEITKEVVKMNGVEFASYKLKSKDKISQGMEMLVFGSYLGLYLGALYGASPLKIQWVDYFKKRMK
jgi:glucose/mannose-6-phosphate isomerase